MTTGLGFKAKLSTWATCFLLCAVACALQAQTNCVVPASGLVGWWRAETNTLDRAGTNNGTLVGNVSYGTGAAGFGFVLDGTGDAVLVGSAPSLQLQNLTIEAWIRRSSTTLVTGSAGNNGMIFGYGAGGYAFLIDPGGHPMISAVNIDAVIASGVITDTNYHHVAMTRSGSTLVFYIDGVQDTTAAYGTGFGFSTPAAIGARGDNLGNSFLGTLDEVSVYNRALSAAEVQSIYGAGSQGKCYGTVAPVIVSQPTNQTATAGDTVTFIVTANGTAPLSYQWQLDTTNLPGQTNRSLVLANVQTNDAGNYSVLVTNIAGSILSSNALLTVTPAPTNCTSSPAGLVGWWTGNGNALDYANTNSGTFAGNTTYGNGRVGQGFVLDGTGDAVLVGSAPSLRLQNLTIEAWIKRSSTTLVTGSPGNNGMIFGYGAGGYAFLLDPGGHPMISAVNIDAVIASGAITDNNFHHVAVTRSGSTLVFYIDGIVDTTAGYGTGFGFSTPAAIGARGDNLGNSFLGTLDEVSVYNRALSASEIQGIYAAGGAGKCALTPFIVSHPTDQIMAVGDTVVFNVAAAGPPPLSYQWNFNGVALPNATNASLTLVNVQTNNAGNYSAAVSNPNGSTTSSNALLTVLVIQTNCATPPAGLVGWWAGEGNPLDRVGTNNGTFTGNATYGSGRVGQGFVFDGTGDAVRVGNAPGLQLQNLTIEAWIKRSSPTLVTGSAGNNGMIFGYGSGGYAFLLNPSGHPMISAVNVDQAIATGAITDTNFHHVAVTRSGSTLVFYIDGISNSAAAYGTAFGFSTQAAIGARGDTLGNSFLGALDEVSVYNRALAAAEIQYIYTAGNQGKCFTTDPPSITSQPTNQTVNQGSSATFAVTATGTPPLSYQWNFNGSPLQSATNNSLLLSGVSTNQAGTYTVLVTNQGGAQLSSNAMLTVNIPPCSPPPSNLVSWWQAQGDATDALGAHNGTLSGGVSFQPGEVGQAFSFNGVDGNVDLGNWFNFQVFSVALWVKANGSQNGSADIMDNLHSDHRSWVIQYGNTGLQFAWYCSDFGSIPFSLTAGAWQYVVVTVDSNFARVYLDGQLQGSITNSHGITYDGTQFLRLGHWGSGGRYFNGQLDEVDVYNRALSGAEISALYNAGGSGKCFTPTAPAIISQPANQSVTVGSNATFSVAASGTAPLSYQWNRNANAIPGATTSSLTLTNVQFNQADAYSVTLTNVAGSVTSSNALLTVNFPPAAVQVVSTNGSGGGAMVVPIILRANGNENAVGFSLNFNPSALTYASISLGSNAAGGTLFVNTSQSGAGKLGIAAALPSGTNFPTGAQEVVRVSFVAAPLTNATITPITFGDVPVGRQLSDPAGNPLAVTFTGGSVSIAATDFEGDVSPRPNGDKAVTITDWVLLGRYAAGLDYPTNASEFQRADCAPRSSFGDGAITVTDWVQAGRYAAGLDPLTPVGGPTTEAPLAPPPGRKDLSRKIDVLDTLLVQGQTGTVPVILEAQGNENALGVSLLFDPTALSYAGASLGSGASGATVNINAAQATSGRLGAVLALGTGSAFTPGNHEILRVNFHVVAPTPGSYPVSFTNLPVRCQVSDTNALALSTAYASALVTVNPLPSLTIAPAGSNNISLSWPLWATNFGLQEATAFESTTIWSNLPVSITTSNGQNEVVLPASSASKYYRLRLP